MTESGHSTMRLAVLGFAFISLSLALEGRLGNLVPTAPIDQESVDKVAAWLAPHIHAEQVDARQSKSHFKDEAVRDWQRSVVSIAVHESLVGETSWHRSRTGFAVSGGLRRLGGQRIVSANAASRDSSPYSMGTKILLHAHPFHMPQPRYATQGHLIREGRLACFLSGGTTIARPVRFADRATANFEEAFPVVLIGFVEDQPTCFYTHSVGVGGHPDEVKLAQRPSPVKVCFEGYWIGV